EETQKWLDAHPTRTQSRQAGQGHAFGPEPVLAFINEDLTLAKLTAKNVRLPNLEGAMLGPEMPPYIARNLFNRRNVMWEKMEPDPALQEKLKGIWTVLFSFAKPLPPDLLAMLRGQVVADVKAIRERGG